MFNRERDIKVYTADIEEPSCIQCDRQTVEEELCEKYCGPEHGWGMYIRFEVIEDSHTMDEFMYGQEDGSQDDGSL